MLSRCVKYIAPSEKNITTLPIVNAGPWSLIPPSLRIAPEQKTPDLQKSAMPAIEMLGNQMARKNSSSSLSQVFNNAPDRRSSSEATAAIEHFSSLNSTAMMLFSRPWRDMLCESTKRAFNPVQNQMIECGRMALEMQQACIERGVPEELFQFIDYRLTKTHIPVGPGSQSARAAQAQQGAALYSSMDASGREAFNRDEAIRIWGPERGGQYINMEPVPRELVDFSIARLENNDLVAGEDVQVSPSENSMVHLQIHVGKLKEYIPLVDEGEMELTDATREMMGLFTHAQQTFEMAVVPDADDQELDYMKQALQQIGEYVNNGIRALKKEQADKQQEQDQMIEEALSAQQEGAQEEQGGVDPKVVSDIQGKQMKAQNDMQIDAAKAAQKMKQDEEAFQQAQVHAREKALVDLAIKDAEGAAKVQNKAI